MPKVNFLQIAPERAATRTDLAPGIHEAFASFSERVFVAGELAAKTKQLIEVAAAHITRCHYRNRGHTKAASRIGATPEETMEAIWIAAEMRAGGSNTHSVLTLDTIDEAQHFAGRP